MTEKQRKTTIILLVAAVAAIFVWKKLKSASSSSSSTDPAAGGKESVEGVIAASGMNSTDAAFVRQTQKRWEASLTEKSRVETEAIARGYTYAQMLVLKALWTKYYDNATSDFKPEYANDNVKSYVWKVQAAIKNM